MAGARRVASPDCDGPVCCTEQQRDARSRYTDTVKKNGHIDAGLERIKRLEEQLARAPVNSGRRRQFARAIRIEADLYRKSLDAEQANEIHESRTDWRTGHRSV